MPDKYRLQQPFTARITHKSDLFGNIINDISKAMRLTWL